MPHTLYAKGYIQVYTGAGKGKTTAAIGVSMRAVAAGMRVLFAQFMKKSSSSEHAIFADYPDKIKLLQLGTGRFIRGAPEAEDYENAAAGWEECKEAIRSGAYDLIVLDELNMALNLGLLPVEKVSDTLRNKPVQTEIIVTGRHAPEELIRIADLVTEMKEVKHYFRQGVDARKGIEE